MIAFLRAEIEPGTVGIRGRIGSNHSATSFVLFVLIYVMCKMISERNVFRHLLNSASRSFSTAELNVLAWKCIKRRRFI
jgi:hypothetical protein